MKRRHLFSVIMLVVALCFQQLVIVAQVDITPLTNNSTSLGVNAKTPRIDVVETQPRHLETAISSIAPRFPEEKPVSNIYVQNRRVFSWYQDSLEVVVKNHGVTSADIYINGQIVSQKIDWAANKNATTVLDIQNVTNCGENSLKVLNIQPKDAHMEIFIPYPVLSNAKPEEVGISSEKLALVDQLINQEVEEGFPGAVLLVLKDGKIVKNTAYGYKLKYDGAKLLEQWAPMTTDTMFDLASNTKMFATNMALQKLATEKKINILDPVSKYIPGFVGEGREEITLYDILTHSAGFSSSIRFYMPDNGFGPDFYSMDRERTIDILNKMPIEYPRGSKTVYSDTDYMLLGVVVENVTGMRLDEYVEKNIYEPLKLANTMFTPLDKGMKKEMFAATETMGNSRGGARNYPLMRTETLQGEVHDEKAFYTMGGVSGHAGLFSNSNDLAVLCQTVLNGGGYGNEKIFNQNVLDYFVSPSFSSVVYGLGWNRAADADKVSQFGPYASHTAIGHTGWTGTLTVIDPEYNMAIVLLTNKKHSSILEKEVFEGDAFETGRYGSVVSLVYEALLEGTNMK